MPPSANKYPETYIIDYRIPVFKDDGQLRQDWHGTVTITLSEPVLINRHAHHGPHVELTSNFKPFNNHVTKTSICSGNGWIVAKDNGLWHFIITLGALINQDGFVCAESAEFDGNAYKHWKRRGRKPVTNINWPLDLISKGNIVIEPKKEEPKPTEEPKNKISIVKKISGQTNPTYKKTIKIVSKSSQQPIKQIRLIKKNNDG